ncbi:uncharacterized protein LOC142591574 [Dermacentor variabilis]|uniref:uncharacterized protein LOC142591574 n=1 Tax=Dermacentor variabilis TaxID=34621 RepID=UPI003F5C9CBA
MGKEKSRSGSRTRGGQGIRGRASPRPAKAKIQIQRPGQVEIDVGYRDPSFPPAQLVEEQSSWIADLTRDVGEATQTITPDFLTEKMDSRLAHLWEAKKSIQTRWQGQRFNRKLRKKIADLNKQIEEHCKTLSKQQWDEVCNAADGELHNGSTWPLLRHLLGETQCKSKQRADMQRFLHKEKGAASEKQIAMKLCEQYLPQRPTVEHGRYTGSLSPKLDEDFSEAEIRTALQGLNSKSAPGPDRANNKTFKNLDDKSVTKFMGYMNKCWREGRIQEQWKRSKAILIPKHGKPLSFENLRPISLTSCVGKVLEHAFLSRISSHLEEMEAYPDTMIGFRSRLSTQDVILQMKSQIFDDKTRNTRAILGLDLEKAFDNAAHESILKQVSNLNLGESAYNYVRDLLNDRKATLTVGGLESEERTQGTPFQLSDAVSPQQTMENRRNPPRYIRRRYNDMGRPRQ